MSASLVGSEMCIRDSAESSDEHILLTDGGAAKARTIRMLPPHVDTLRAVSYTHLTLPTICSV
eukprot:4785863-Alexandrium_andersonii.AAC.1